MIHGTPREANSLSPVPSAARPSRTARRMLFSFTCHLQLRWIVGQRGTRPHSPGAVILPSQLYPIVEECVLRSTAGWPQRKKIAFERVNMPGHAGQSHTGCERLHDNGGKPAVFPPSDLTRHDCWAVCLAQCPCRMARGTPHTSHGVSSYVPSRRAIRRLLMRLRQDGAISTARRSSCCLLASAEDAGDRMGL